MTVPARAILLLGAGGVGKTSVAAGLGHAYAAEGHRTVVLTVDPARRLMEALGIDGAAPSDIVTVDVAGPGTLAVTMLDPPSVLADLIRWLAPDPARIERIDANRIYRTLLGSISGLGDYMATERLRQLVDDPRFDVIVVDTPPAQHGVDILDAPRRLIDLLDHPVYRRLLSPGATLLNPVTAAMTLAARAISKVVGNSLLTEAIEFFGLFDGMDEPLGQRMREVDTLIRSDRCAVTLVTTATPSALDVARWLEQELERRDIGIDTAVVNRRSMPVPVPPDCGPAIRRALEEHNRYGAGEIELLERHPLGKVPGRVDIGETESDDPMERIRAIARDLSIYRTHAAE